MQALFIESKQGPFVMGPRDIPSVPAGEVLIKVLATSLNPVDWKIQTYGAFVQHYPAIVGTDIAGEIEAVGEGVEGWTKGDKIFAQGWFSNERASFQQYTLLPADLVCKLPKNISIDAAATIPVAFMAPCMGLFADAPVGAGLNPTFSWDAKYAGQTAVVIGGNASVGQYAIQLFKFLGYTRIIAYASSAHTEHLRSLGATDVVDRSNTPITSLASAIHTLVGSSDAIKIVMDGVGTADTQRAAYDTLAEGGKGITVQTLDPTVNKPGEGKTIAACLGSVHPPTHRAFGLLVVDNLTRMVEEGVIVPNRYEVLEGGLKSIPGGLERMKKNEISGKKMVVHPQEL